MSFIGIWTYYCRSLFAAASAAVLHQGEIVFVNASKCCCIREIKSTVVDGARGSECALHLTLLHVLEVNDVTVLSYAVKLTERI